MSYICRAKTLNYVKKPNNKRTNKMTCTTQNILLMYLAVINVITFFVYGIDKLKAKKNWQRISEATLLWLAAVGGSLGAMLGMKVWHHKTLHKKFKYGVPAILILQLALAAFSIYAVACNI